MDWNTVTRKAAETIDALFARPMRISKSMTFEAAHRLPKHDDTGRRGYGRVHGHSFLVEVVLEATPDNERGWVADLGGVTDALATLRGRLDHGMLNDLPGLETPTLERLCAWIAGEFAILLGDDGVKLTDVAVSRPSLGETCRLTVK